MRVLTLPALLAALAACSPSVPESGPQAGFDRGDAAQLRAGRDARLEAPSTVTTAPLRSGDPIADTATAALAASNSGQVPLQASPANPVPGGHAGISNENDFSAVSARRDIEDDAARIAAVRAQRQVITPTALAPRSASGPNIVEFALRTSHQPGQKLYGRGYRRASRTAQACASYASPDQAQIAFLAAGGPERDREGLDPDGDGFACGWDPRPFRAVRGGT